MKQRPDGKSGLDNRAISRGRDDPSASLLPGSVAADGAKPLVNRRRLPGKHSRIIASTRVFGESPGTRPGHRASRKRRSSPGSLRGIRGGGGKILWRTGTRPVIIGPFAALRGLPGPIAGNESFDGRSGRAPRAYRASPAPPAGASHPHDSSGLASILVASLAAPSSRRPTSARPRRRSAVGRYDDAARMAAEEVRNGSWVERWHLLKVRAELAQGLYPAALGSLEDGLRRLPGSVACSARPATSTATTAARPTPTPRWE